MNSMGNLLILVAGSFFLYFLRALLKAFYNYWWIPHRIQNILRSQGIKGPPYEFIHGNNKAVVESIREASSKPMALTHDIFPRVLPHIYSCINTYGETWCHFPLGFLSSASRKRFNSLFFCVLWLGKIYLSWNGVRALLVITEPDLIKEVLKNSEKAFPKRKVTYFLSKILGDGLATTVREKWARQRKLANYAFHGESLKVKLPMKTTVL